MQRQIEALESRVFLSVSQVASDLGTLKAGANGIKAELTALGRKGAADIKAIAADLKRLKAPSDTTLLKALEATTKAGVGSLTKQTGSLISSGTKEAAPIISDLKQLLKSPENATVQAKLAVAAGLLEANITAKVNALNSFANTFATTAFTELGVALAGANSSDAKMQTDVGTLETDLSTGAGVAQNDLNSLLATANTLVTDAGA